MPFYWDDNENEVPAGQELISGPGGYLRAGCLCVACYDAFHNREGHTWAAPGGMEVYYDAPYDEVDPYTRPRSTLALDHTMLPVRRGRRREDPRLPYTYKPPWIMNGDGKLFYGMEIEIECGSLPLMDKVARTVEPLAILKRDSSVAGFELVTHPMSYEFAMANFPWGLLPELEADGCSVTPSTNGIHVHVSRAGFAGPTHMYRWLKLLYRNQQQVSRIARRTSDRWAPFRTSVQASHLTHIRSGKARLAEHELAEKYRSGSHRGNLEEERRLVMELEEAQRRRHWLESHDRTLRDRHEAVNMGNADTVELRVFASTLRELEAKAALQFADATVLYTASPEFKRNGAGWEWPAFSQWLRDNGGRYPELLRANEYANTPRSASSVYTMSSTARRDVR